MTYPCPHCACVFCSEHDLKAHLRIFPATKEAHIERFRQLHKKIEHGSTVDEGVGEDSGRERNPVWRPSKWGGAEWCFASDEPSVSAACRSNGKVVMGDFAVTLDASGKYLRRVRA